MNIRRRKVSMKEQMESAIEEIGGEPLAGSGFEDEKPDKAYSGASVLPSTFINVPKDL